MYDTIYVKISMNDDDLTVGKLFFRRGRGYEWQEFLYNEHWLKHGFPIDPELPLNHGLFRASRYEFGCFKDAAPDSWGRSLIRRMFKKQNKLTLFPSDYLLSVSDKYCIGAFRFYDLNNNIIPQDNFNIPVVKDLRTFQYLIGQIQSNYEICDADFNDILNHGSSLGGARPKISIIDDQNKLWIAKFSSNKDTFNVPAREAISLSIAKACKINVPDFKILTFDSNKSVLLVKRFDRNGDIRIPYMSAMTFLQAIDGSSNNYSYLDIASIIEEHSNDEVKLDLIELFKRMILNILIGNRDDHLRNHGFIYKNNNWRLSPVFDLEISPDKSHHALALDDSGSLLCDLKAVINVSEYYGLENIDAKNIILEISEHIYDWKKFAKNLLLESNTINNLPDVKLYHDELAELKTL